METNAFFPVSCTFFKVLKDACRGMSTILPFLINGSRKKSVFSTYFPPFLLNTTSFFFLRAVPHFYLMLYFFTACFNSHGGGGPQKQKKKMGSQFFISHRYSIQLVKHKKVGQHILLFGRYKNAVYFPSSLLCYAFYFSCVPFGE